jgi:hypothetical protein
LLYCTKVAVQLAHLAKPYGSNIMVYRDALFAAVALLVSTLAVAALLTTDVYSQAAQAEATGVDALTSQVVGVSPALCWNQGKAAEAGAQSVRQ